MADPFPGYQADDIAADPFAAFVMAEWHTPDVEAKVRHEELAAVPFQVECRLAHGDADVAPEAQVPSERPCPACGAVV